MTQEFVDHHMLAIYTCSNAAIELLHTQPETDFICELRSLLEDQFDVIDCMLHKRHFGSDNLDIVIDHCNKVLTSIQEFEES